MPAPSEVFAGLEDRLLRGGIAPRHVKRYLRELSEHLADLTEAQRDLGHDQTDAAARARAALGPDAELADAMLKQRDFRSLAARFPWLAFSMGALAATAAVVMPPVLSVVAVTQAQKHLFGAAILEPLWFQTGVHMVFAAVNFAAMPLAALLLTVIAWRQRLSPLWLLLSMAMLLPLVICVQGEFPDAAQIARHQEGSLSVGAGLSLGYGKLQKEVAAIGYWAVLRDLLIVLPPLWLMARSRLAKVPVPS